MTKTNMGNYYKFPFRRPVLNIEKTMRKIAELNNNNELVIFGAGLQSLSLFYYLKDDGIDIACFCDNDDTKIGKAYCGKPIISKDELIAGKDKYRVLIGADCYADEITNGLCENGFPSENIVSVRERQVENIIVPKEMAEDINGLEEYTFEMKHKASAEPLITIFMQCYDAPGFYVDRAIQSVLSQTFTAFELLIIDNAANTENKETIGYYESIDSRIKVLHLSKNTHCNAESYKMINNWLAESITGKYFCKLDSDDYLSPVFFERTYDVAETHNADLVAGNLLWYNESDCSRLRWCGTIGPNEIVLSNPGEIANEIMRNVMKFGSKQSKLYRTEKLLEHYLHQVSIPDSIVSAVQKMDKAVILKEFQYFYTIRKGSISTTPNIIADTANSDYGIIKKVFDGFMSMLTQCDCITERNLCIAMQNYLNQINQAVVRNLEMAKDSHAAYQIANTIIDDFNSIEKLYEFPEYDTLTARLQNIVNNNKVFTNDS